MGSIADHNSDDDSANVTLHDESSTYYQIFSVTNLGMIGTLFENGGGINS